MEVQSPHPQTENSPIHRDKIEALRLRRARAIKHAFFQQHHENKKARAQPAEANHLHHNPLKSQASTGEISNLLPSQHAFNVRKLPTEAWINIFSFIAHYEQLSKISSSCKLFEKICGANILWLNSLKVSWPLVYSKYDLASTNVKDVEWKKIVREKCLVFKKFKHILKTLQKQKDQADALFQAEETEEAAKCYRDAINYMKESSKDLDLIPVVPKTMIIESFKISAILLYGSSVAEGKLGNWPKSFYDAGKARKKLRLIKELIKDPETYQTTNGPLEEKIIFQMKLAWINFPALTYARYSDEVVEGVGAGTLIEATENISGGILGGAKILITEYNRGQSTKGVIVSKTLSVQGKRVRIGGSKDIGNVTVLHNIPQAEGAKLISEGIWMGGNVEPFKGNPNYQINEYYGHVAWFAGQLDGELRYGDWTWNNSNSVASQVFQD